MGKVKSLFQTKQFLRDVKRIKKRGKDITKLQAIVTLLANDQQLPAKHKDHQLKGNWAGTRDCHIEPDWILIYTTDSNSLRLERTGSHADLFD